MAEEKTNDKDPRKRIMDAAVKLFARQCYAATGTRELAQEAGVNLAAINYYFGSKHNILAEVISEYFTKMEEIARGCFVGPASPEEKIRAFIREAVRFMRENKDIVFISATEISYELDAISEIKAKHLQSIQNLVMNELVPTLGALMGREFRPEVVITAVAGLLMMHFISSNVLEKIIPVPLDDKFYDEYTEEITRLALYGLIGRPPNKGA